MMDCTDVRDRLEAHLLEVLEADEARACDAHLAFCHPCRARQAELEDLLGLLGRLAGADPARSGLEDRILARPGGPARASGPLSRRARAGLAAAAAVLIAAAGYLAGLRGGGPEDPLASRLDAQQRLLEELREGVGALQARDALQARAADRLARLEERLERHESTLADLRNTRPDGTPILERKWQDQERRIKDLEQQLADTVVQMASLRDQTIDAFLKVASVVSTPLVRN